jgi:hypothetical protein
VFHKGLSAETSVGILIFIRGRAALSRSDDLTNWSGGDILPIMAKAKNIPITRVSAFSSTVPVGEYRWYTCESQLPKDIPWGGLDCRGIMIAASSYSAELSSSLPYEKKAAGPVFLWRAFRKGQSGTDLIAKNDQALCYTNGDNEACWVHSKKSPDHHNGVIAGTAFSDIAIVNHIPSAPGGTLEELRAEGATADFEGPFR